MASSACFRLEIQTLERKQLVFFPLSEISLVGALAKLSAPPKEGLVVGVKAQILQWVDQKTDGCWGPKAPGDPEKPPLESLAVLFPAHTHL